MTALNPVDWEILNITADDCENLEQIYLGVCFEMVAAAPDHLTHNYRRVRPAVRQHRVHRLRALRVSEERAHDRRERRDVGGGAPK